MKQPSATVSSLAFFQNPYYAGTRTNVSHGDTEVFAPYSGEWLQRSVGIDAPDKLRAFIWSMVDVSNVNQSYAGHVENYVKNAIPDLEQAYYSPQYPLQYVGLDTSLSVPVWVQVQVTTENSANAFAATTLINGTPTTVTTLVSPITEGVMGFIGASSGSSTYVTLNCGVYNSASHEIIWQTESSLMMKYINGQLEFSDESSLPDGWTFSSPMQQLDGSWKCILTDNAVPSDEGITVDSDTDSIVDNGVDGATVTAKVTNSGGQPAQGETVTWSSTLGTVTPPTSITGVDGKTMATLTVLGSTGTATVTGTLKSGTNSSVNIAVTDSAADETITVSSNTDSIVDDGVSSATLTAKVANSSGLAVQGENVSWSCTSAGVVSPASSTTNADGEATATLKGTGTPGDVTVTAALDSGKVGTTVVAMTAPATGGITLYHQGNYQGDSVSLAVHESLVLQNQLRQWQYLSAKMNENSLLSYTTYTSLNTRYDFRTYRENIDNTDITDISSEFSLNSDPIEGVALGPNDVIIRIRATTDDGQGALVVSARQTNLNNILTASVTQNKISSLGILAVIDRTSTDPTIVPFRVGKMLADGTVSGWVEAKCVIKWNTEYSRPEMMMTGDYPESWHISQPIQGETENTFITNLTGISLRPRVRPMGARKNPNVTYGNKNNLITALDADNLATVNAQWQYEGDSEWLDSAYFYDEYQEKRLLVRLDAQDMPVVLNESNVCGNMSNSTSARTDEGTVITWGEETTTQNALNHDVKAMTSTWSNFIAVNADGKVFGWPSEVPSDISSTANVVGVYSASYNYAILTQDGQVKSEGVTLPADIAQLRDIKLVVGGGGSGCFAALRSNGQVVVWGDGPAATLPSNIASLMDIEEIVSANNSFAARRSNGQVVTWGDISQPDNISQLTNVAHLFGGYTTLSATLQSGQVVSWGACPLPSEYASLSGVVGVFGDGARPRMALRNNGEVFAWDSEGVYTLPDEISSLTDVIGYSESQSSVALLRRTGEAACFGDISIPDDIAQQLTGSRAIYGSEEMYSAIKDDGTLVVWGNNPAGKQPNVPSELQGNIRYEVKSAGELGVEYQVTLDPYNQNKLSAHVSIKCDEPASYSYTVKGKTESADFSFSSTSIGSQQVVSVVGLYPDYDNIVNINVYSKNKSTNLAIIISTKGQDYAGVPLKLDMKITDSDIANDTLNGNFFITSNLNGYDINGDLRVTGLYSWNNCSLRIIDHALYTTDGTKTYHPENKGYSSVLYKINLLGEVKQTYTAPDGFGFHHDIISDGKENLFILGSRLGGESDDEKLESIIYKYDRKSGALLWQRDYSAEFKNSFALDNADTNDVHFNSLEYSVGTEQLIVNSRSTSTIIGLNAESGDMEWIIDNTQGSVLNKNINLSIVNSASFHYPNGEHCVAMTNNTKYDKYRGAGKIVLSLFNNKSCMDDNGNDLLRPMEDSPPEFTRAEPNSEVMIIVVDTRSKTVECVDVFSFEGYKSQWCSSVFDINNYYNVFFADTESFIIFNAKTSTPAVTVNSVGSGLGYRCRVFTHDELETILM